jgi:ribosomal-protein-serine acetyltransferase
MKKQHFPEILIGKRITLKKHQQNLASVMFHYVDQDRQRLRTFLPWVDETTTIKDEINYIQMTQEKWERFELYDYGIFQTEADLYMGNIGVHTISWAHECCEIGYWILGDYEGKGFISEAVKLLQEESFSQGFHRVEIRCSSLNKKSSAVPRRLGFCFEATLKENMIERGKYRDTMIFSLLNNH